MDTKRTHWLLAAAILLLALNLLINFKPYEFKQLTYAKVLRMNVYTGSIVVIQSFEAE